MQNNFWVRLVGIAVVIYGLYYLVSPYQNCLRSEGGYADYLERERKKVSFSAPIPDRPITSNPFLALPTVGWVPDGAMSLKEWQKEQEMPCLRVAAW